MEGNKIVTRDSLINENMDMFFQSLLNSVDIDVMEKIKDKFYSFFAWYVSNYNLDQDRFGYEILSYLIFLYKHNLLDQITVKSLSNTARLTSGYKIPKVHFLFNFPKEYHDYDIEDYYKEMIGWLRNLSERGICFENDKFIAIFNHHKYRTNPCSNDWVNYMTAYLYQNQTYNTSDYYKIYGAIDANKEEYKDYLELNGMKDNLEKEKVEAILDSYINMKLGYQKRIK